ncbi:MAG: ATP-binding protein [Salinibacter sp.]
MERLFDVLRSVSWWGGLGGGLALALALTAVGRWAATEYVAEHAEARQQEVVQEALSTTERRFEAMRDQALGRAQQLAGDSVLVQGLQQWQNTGERPSDFLRHVSTLSRPDQTAIEVYSPVPRVLAWNGERLPLGTAPDSDAFLREVQSEIVVDGAVREALSVWVPVQANGKTLGAVRVVRVLRYQPPVQNRYIRGFDVSNRWAEATGEAVQVTWGGAAPPDADEHARALRGPNGDVLGVARVAPPAPERLVRRTAALYDDVLAGWAALLLLWGLWGAGAWYLTLGARPGLRRCARARTAAAARFLVVGGAWVGARYAFLGLDVPGRWVGQLEVFRALFDPTQFASALGGGIFRSIGDLFLTSVWFVVLAVGAMHLARAYRLRADSLRALWRRLSTAVPRQPSSLRFLGVVLGLLAIGFGAPMGLAYVVRRAVLDSTLDFFSRTGLLPEPLVLVVLCALFLLVVAALLLGVAALWIGGRWALRSRPTHWPRGLALLSIVTLFLVGYVAIYVRPTAPDLVPAAYPLALIGVLGGAAVYGMVGRGGGLDALTVRGHLLSLFAVTLLLYPLLYAGMDAQRRERMVDAARSFEEGYDPRVLYSIQQVLRTAREELPPTMNEAARGRVGPVDSVMTRLVQRSLLASLTTYEVRLSLYNANGSLVRGYAALGERTRRADVQADRSIFEDLRRAYTQRARPDPLVNRLPNERGEQFQYAGLFSIPSDDGTVAYWVLLHAEPRSLLPGTGAGVPRVLLPGGGYSDLYADLSLAEFRDGTLARSFGKSFERTQLPGPYRDQLTDTPSFWRTETMQGQEYLTYYRRADGPEASTVAVRIPAILAFDHLYYLLRLIVAGLGVGVFFYLVGMYGRYRKGMLPARRLRFRDKVLNAFLVVGVVSMVAVGIVGVRVVTGENDRVVERQLREQMARVEEALALEARSGEQLWQVAERVDVDSLAARVGLDLRIYEDGQLAGTSRPRLVRDDLIDERLPGPVYYALYEESYRFASAEATIGDFQYRVGYQVLADEEGRPRFVLGMPTLAQQEQLEQEQARTLAYLFGALLVLVVVVMLTAVVLANALAQPIARLREGLEAVGEGRFARPLTVNTRDEIGDLVRTFNEMREQLSESRRKLAQQERELAWREMARQVAHEIKNPLTPMKLSIQHLRRTFKREQPAGDDAAFTSAFDRITTTLIEQIESLVRIADEFSTFARLPTRVPEPLDLNEVIEEAVRLMEEETDMEQLELALHPEPLVVEADREELRRIYINLIKNALQAIPDDRQGEVRITTTPAKTPEGSPVAQSRVIDNGTGIPPGLRGKIFEPNFSTKTSGTGLGLAIAQKAIDELDGRIGFETAEGEGTTFWVQLPLSEDDAPGTS